MGRGELCERSCVSARSERVVGEGLNDGIVEGSRVGSAERAQYSGTPGGGGRVMESGQQNGEATRERRGAKTPAALPGCGTFF